MPPRWQGETDMSETSQSKHHWRQWVMANPAESVAPAIANAVYRAAGRRSRDLPISVEKLL